MVKKKAEKKVHKPVPKKSAKRPITPTRGLMAVIPYSEIQKVETYKGKFSMVASQLNERQVMAIIAPTPPQAIQSRPGKGGGNWNYVPGWWFKKKLNFVFGFDGWDTIVEGERVDGDFITVKGKLVIHNTKTGKPIVTKSDYGGAAIKYFKDKPHVPANYLDFPNDFKAAQTDMIKRCCVQLGFCMDVYGKIESAEAGIVVQVAPVKAMPVKVADGGKVIAKVDLKPGQVIGPDGNPTYLCDVCSTPIKEQEKAYSEKIYKKALCRNCQAILKNNPNK